MLRPQGWDNDPIWPRPFSICEKNDDSLRIFIQIVGRGTGLISRLQPGSTLHIWGPLGNGFQFSPDMPLLILAGGMGIAPFVGLCKSHPNPELIRFIFGHRMDIGCYPFAELPPASSRIHLQQTGQADIFDFQRLLRQEIEDCPAGSRILACGPTPFLKVVQEYARESVKDAWMSLENKMACGVGACLGCVTMTSSGDYVQTCSHGPVFRAEDVVFEE